MGTMMMVRRTMMPTMSHTRIFMSLIHICEAVSKNRPMAKLWVASSLVAYLLSDSVGAAAEALCRDGEVVGLVLQGV